MVLIISHDTDFLDQVINKILFINKSTHKISVYDGNYDIYKKKYEQEKRLQELVIDREEKEIKELEGFVQRQDRQAVPIMPLSAWVRSGRCAWRRNRMRCTGAKGSAGALKWISAPCGRVPVSHWK